MSTSSVTDWITAGSLLLLVVLFAHAIVRYGDEHRERGRLWQLHSGREWPDWAVKINKKVEHIMGVTEDIQAALVSLRAIEAEIGIYAADAQARIAELEGKLSDGAVDPAAVDALTAELAAFKERADALAAQFPEVQPTPEPAPEPAPEEAPAE